MNGRIALAFLIAAGFIAAVVFVIYKLYWFFFIVPQAKLIKREYDGVKEAVDEAEEILKPKQPKRKRGKSK